MENQENLEMQEEVKSGIANKIVSIVLLALCVALVVTVVLCSFLPKNFNPGLNEPDYIVVHTQDTSSPANKSQYAKNSEEYKELLRLYNESFETTVFGALFQGRALEGVTEEEGHKSLSSLSGPYLEFNYTTSQKVYVNGELLVDYLAKQGKSPMVSNTDYISAVVEVYNTTSLSQIRVYFKYRDTGTNDYSYIRLATYAKQSALYDYIEDLGK